MLSEVEKELVGVIWTERECAVDSHIREVGYACNIWRRWLLRMMKSRRRRNV